MANSRRSPLQPLWTFLNTFACFGWSYVLYILLAGLALGSDDALLSNPLVDLQTPVLVLEAICAVEVVRILVGDLPGNAVLGVVLHIIRFVAITEVLPRADEGHWTVNAVLISWAITEVTRYPMYIFPSVEGFRSMRMVVPLFTFPAGCFSEGYGAYMVLMQDGTPSWLKVALCGMIFVNGVLGPTMAYPALLKKGLPVLGLGKKKEANQKKNA